MGMQMRLRNVGPIRTGSFEISDLTIFVGPNNSGKSVAAICAYAASIPEGIPSLFGPASPSLTKHGQSVGWLQLPRWTMSESDFALFVEQIEDALQQVLSGRDDRAVRLSPSLESFAKNHIEHTLSVYGFRLVDELERCFGTKLRDLARRSADKQSNILVRNPKCRWTVEINLRKGSRPVVKRHPSGRPLVLATLKRMKRWHNSARKEGLTPQQVANDFTLSLTRQLFQSEFPRGAQYLPAERSGILQGHRLLAGAVLRRAPYVGVERLDMPQMSGVITDFLSNILEIDETGQDSTMYDSDASQLESTILQGSIAIQRQEHGYPEIGYRRDKQTFPLHRVSSMVTELAPIVLYLRNLLSPGDLFIVEEPESHLHPENQLLIAELLTNLLNRNLRLLLTTHSDYFLGAVSNAIRLASLQEDMPNSGVSPVDKDRVTAYIFSRGGKNGSRITRAAISDADGIDEDEFARVTNELYDVGARLQEKSLRAQQSDL
jgi:predicted ATPase